MLPFFSECTSSHSPYASCQPHYPNLKFLVKFLEFSKFLLWAPFNSFLFFLCLYAYPFFNFNELSLLITQKLSSTLNLTLMLQILPSLLLSKLWYHLLEMKLSILVNHWQIFYKAIKNQGKTKTKAMSLMSLLTTLLI